jgi:hypothetical protein
MLRKVCMEGSVVRNRRGNLHGNQIPLIPYIR